MCGMHAYMNKIYLTTLLLLQIFSSYSLILCATTDSVTCIAGSIILILLKELAIQSATLSKNNYVKFMACACLIEKLYN